MTKAFVVGHPIKHSRSPMIHNYWLNEHRISGSYEAIDIAPEAFARFLETMADQGFAGGNVTIPHKEAAFKGVTRRTERAERLRAVNTLHFEGGQLFGDNTDIVGFTAHLDQTLGPDWVQRVDTALVIGAGGAARAIVAGLLDRVDRILVVNRTGGKGQDLAADLKSHASTAIRVVPWERIGEAIAGAQLLVNTTSLGMVGQPPLILDLDRAPEGAIVADIVYVPLTTPLLAAAEARALTVVDGLGMLLHQAVPGFARWFGVTPQVTADLRARVAADIEAKG
jgi:shikimate dehydrogenase